MQEGHKLALIWLIIMRQDIGITNKDLIALTCLETELRRRLNDSLESAIHITLANIKDFGRLG